jgi:hypothetical protein
MPISSHSLHTSHLIDTLHTSPEQEFNAEASDHGCRSISPTQHTQPSPATSPPVLSLRDNSNPTVLLTDAAASLAAATATTDSNLTTEDSRMNLDNNVNESTNKGERRPEAISNVTENQPPLAAGYKTTPSPMYHTSIQQQATNATMDNGKQ